MKRSYGIVVLIFFIFFVISFFTNILDPLTPEAIRGFQLSLTMAAFLPFSFFIAYGVISVPSGILLEKYKEKPVMVAAFTLACIGSLLFASVPGYSVWLGSLFLLGLGMAMLQVAINPLLRVSGGEEHFAFFSVFAQLVFSSASFVSPHVYSYLVKNLKGYTGGGNVLIDTLSKVVPKDLPWVSLYWVFAGVSLLTIAIIVLTRLPKVELTDEEKVGSWATHIELLKNPTVLLYFIGVFCYVGSEQGVAIWISKFLSTYHSFAPETVGAGAVGGFWLSMTGGCLLGLFLLKIFDSRRILVWFAGLAMVTVAAALFGPAAVSLRAFPLIGFFFSVMWSILFSLSLNSMDKNHGAFSGILCTGVIGGAIVPLIIGKLGDLFGLRAGMLFLYLTLGYIFSIGIWAKPLITNKTFGSSEPVASSGSKRC